VEASWREQRAAELRAIWQSNPDRILALYHDLTAVVLSEPQDMRADDLIEFIVNSEECNHF
jgi:hypothetical protein